jgi:hypothetical protein
MKLIHLIPAICILLMISACSNGASPVAPAGNLNSENNVNSETFVPKDASDVLYSSANPEQAYKAYGIYHVVIDPVSLTGEITSARNASAIGDVFDADLTQFLTVSPCPNCLMINGIQVINGTQIQVGFSVKHPFGDISKRPDLHGFDVRGIVLAQGNYNFPQTNVLLDASTAVPARANVTLVENPDGFTHHFDELAADTHYFNPPRNYNANINPYKRFFENSATGPFDPHAPAGYNVMPTGASWDTKNYIFNTSASPLDFGFIVDCSYGVSARFSNRNNPYYFLPEFNRKEAWKVESAITSNNLQSGNISSSAMIQVSACDWQAGLVPDPNYPDTSNLGGIREKSDVFCASVEIAGVSTLVTHTGPTGTGTVSDPYIFNIPQSNTSGAASGWYYGIVAVRDDLHGTSGPMGIPESPTGFPYPGPDIVDYQTYSIFKIRVSGTPPTIGMFVMPGTVYENAIIHWSGDIIEPDGDQITYHWEQTSVNTADGFFEDDSVLDAIWHAPSLYDIPLTGEQFTLRLTVSDPDGSDFQDFTFPVYELNHQPECHGLWSNPYYGVIRPPERIIISPDITDPDGDSLAIDWDMDWDGDPGNFDVDSQADYIYNWAWNDQGFYDVCARATEDRTNPLVAYCDRTFIQEGFTNDIVNIDEDPTPVTNYRQVDIDLQSEMPFGPYVHAVWSSIGEGSVFYANNYGDRDNFDNHEIIFSGSDDYYGHMPKVVASEEFVYVVYLERDTSTPPDTTYLKCRISSDSGLTFGSEKTILSAVDPETITEIDAHTGPTGYDLVVAVMGYTQIGPPTYFTTVWATPDNGQNWVAFGGTIRDVVSVDITYDPHIDISNENDVIHVFWLDRRGGGWSYYYDWSEDSGSTWNTDILVTGTDLVSYAFMQVTYPGDGYFSWYVNPGAIKFAKTTFGAPPILGSPVLVWQDAVAALKGIDLYASLYADTLDIAFIEATGGQYTFNHFYSNDHGDTFDQISRSVGITHTGYLKIDGYRSESPGRAVIATAWIRDLGTVYCYGHIDCDYLYLAERF